MTLSDGATSGGVPWWGTALIALVIAAVPSIIGYVASRDIRSQAERSAEQAAAQADAARVSAEEMDRLRRLEDRVRDAKVKAYMPLIKVLGRLLQGGSATRSQSEQARLDQSLRDAVENFWTEGLVYSSDRMQRAMGRLMQGTFAAAPSAVLLRLASELLLAARLDLGDDRSAITLTEIWAPKLKDLFSKESTISGFESLSFDALARRENWEVPWNGSTLTHRPDEDPGLSP